MLVNDATLQLLIELRPSSLQDLSAVSGFGTAALQHFGQPLLAVIQEFCSASQHLKHNTDWVQVKRMRTAAQAGQQQQFQQHLQQFKMTQQQPTAAGLTQGPSQAVLQASPWVSRAGSDAAAAAAAAAAGGDAAMAQQQDDPQQLLGESSHLTADSEVYQGLLDAKVLSEPKKAAQAAWEQWQQGRSMQQIAQERDKPIQDSTVLGYLADAAACYGCTTHKVQQLQVEGALGGDAAGDALLWRLVTAINGNKCCALSFLKSNLPAEVSYGQIKVGFVAGLWGSTEQSTLCSASALSHITASSAQLLGTSRSSTRASSAKLSLNYSLYNRCVPNIRYVQMHTWAECSQLATI